MKKLSLALMFLFLQFGCQNHRILKANIDASVQIAAENPVLSLSDENINREISNDASYPGNTIDQVFPIIEAHDFTEEDLREKTYSVNTDNLRITVKKFAPQNITENGKIIFLFSTLYPNDYHSNIVGISNLLGKNSKQIYVVAVGPGAVCCTNYWITDVSGKKPRNLFRSEDFGSFRDPMEIFDADGDGIYELVQFDSAFRYFMEDCGACSPEPRAVFKYDKNSGAYLPARNLQQDFVRKSFLDTENWITESFAAFEKDPSPELKLEYHGRFLSHVVDLFYLGDEQKAWKFFDKYYPDGDDKEKMRAEIKNRLKQSKFFQGLKKSA